MIFLNNLFKQDLDSILSRDSDEVNFLHYAVLQNGDD